MGLHVSVWDMDESMEREKHTCERGFIACSEWTQNNAISKRVAFGQATATGVESAGAGIGWNQVDISKSGMGGHPLSDQALVYGHCLVDALILLVTSLLPVELYEYDTIKVFPETSRCEHSSRAAFDLVRNNA